MSRKLKIGAFVLALISATIFIHAWLAFHDDFVQLQATLSAQKQTIDAANARELERAASLTDTLAQIDELKHAAQSPAQILSELRKYLSLPAPITLVAKGQNPAPTDNLIPNAIATVPSTRPSADDQLSTTKNSPMDEKDGKGSEAVPGPGLGPGVTGAISNSDLPDVPQARVPLADLKPLYDYVQDCRACQAQLAAARLNAADDAAKLNALIQERDAAIRASKGGRIGRRIRRNLGWFWAGAAAGLIVTCASGHCRQ